MYSVQFFYRQEISQSLEHQQQNVFGHQYWVRLIENHEKTVNCLLNRRYNIFDSTVSLTLQSWLHTQISLRIQDHMQKYFSIRITGTDG